MAAAEAGADYYGIVFVPGRRRRVDVGDALAITTRVRESGSSAPVPVGLFGDQPLQDVTRVIGEAGLDCVQLCGDETVEYCRRVQEFARVIKVLHVPNEADADAIESLGGKIDAYSAAGCIVTLDSQVPGLHGGTGQAFDWSVAGRLSAAGRRFLLAGGLTPENVANAVEVASPWGVDVSSGVEIDGAQDHQKIRDFIANAKLGNRSTEVS